MKEKAVHTKNIEYDAMAEYYDLFYKNKNYEAEAEFINKFIPESAKSLLDVGCGTGSHLKHFENRLSLVGVDLNPQIVEVAKRKVKGSFVVADMLKLNLNQTFDVAISMFAVFNHVNSYRELKLLLRNIYSHLNKRGVLIFDIHNPQKSGRKVDEFEGYKRTMRWKIGLFRKYEYSKINYEIDGKTIKTKHKFLIFNLERTKKIVEECGYKICGVFKNYTELPADSTSKNVQFVARKR